MVCGSKTEEAMQTSTQASRLFEKENLECVRLDGARASGEVIPSESAGENLRIVGSLVDESHVDESHVDESHVDESHVDESQEEDFAALLGGQDAAQSICPSLAAQEEVASVFVRSKLFTMREQRRYWAQLPRFEGKELAAGEVLGSGAFCTVTEISSIRLRKGGAGKGEGGGEVARNYVSEEGREFMAKHCIRQNRERDSDDECYTDEIHTKQSRYAMKTYNKDSLHNSESFFVAAIDLAIEAHFLSVIDHPNIIKLRGLAVEKPATRNFFIVLDRLYDTLEERIEKWRKRDANRKRLLRRILKTGSSKEKKQKKFLDERVTAGADLASALDHMHGRNILHRDLKPDNIGFDVRNDVKIFDFGLAKEIIPETESIDGTYRLSGETGTIRYMAPEVFLNQPYGKAVDIYSFGLVLWGMFALETPYIGFDLNMMRKFVFAQGLRPKVNESWPESIRKTISSAWAVSFLERPSAGSIVEALKGELIMIRGGDDSNRRGLDHNTRRSTFLSTLKKWSSSKRLLFENAAAEAEEDEEPSASKRGPE